MISNIISAEPNSPDARLVESVLNGDRDAFAELVTKYQNPIAAFAYSACGDIAQSEDLAQETFIIAWRKLRDLREPAKFKSWLFGIARNLINNSARKQTRNPLAKSDELDENLTSTAPATNPTEHAITKEEQAILWQALENIPEPYREPLVLFYREHQSIQRVAETLDLTEEAARQRLSRGRKLLHERVVAFVEGALAQTAPNPQFTAGVMAALPGMALTSTLTATTVKGATAKTAIAATLSAFLLPIITSFGAIWVFGHELTTFPRERKFALKAYTAFAFAIVFYIVAVGLVYNYADWDEHYELWTISMAASVFVFGGAVGKYLWWVVRKQLRLRREEAGTSYTPGLFGWKQPYDWRTERSFLGLPLIHVRFNLELDDKTAAKGWIAIGTRANGILFAAGGVARALISLGGQAFGVFAFGGCSIGLLAFGGFALGLVSMGGGAIGYIAFGGAAIGWLGAAGGNPIARHYAVGGSPLALHANDDVANAFMQHNFFFQHAENATGIFILLSFVPVLVMVVVNRLVKRRAKAAASVSAKL